MRRNLTDVHHPIAHYRESDGSTQPLSAHLLAVAAHAKSFAGKVGLADLGELIGLLHDLGKYSQEFQVYIRSATGLLNQDEDEEFVDAASLKGKIDHSTAGAQLVWREIGQREFGQIVGQTLALCIASHHSGLIDCLTSDANSLGEDAFYKRMNKSDERTHFKEAINKADKAILGRFHELIVQIDLADALITSIKRIAELDKEAGEIIICQKIGLLVRYLFSCLIDADRIDSADFEYPIQAKLRMRGGYSAWETLIDRLERDLGSRDLEHPIDRIRRDLSRHCLKGASRGKGIYTLTVPTGGGKTLASLRFALHHAKTHGMDRVINVIPFTTIIDQNAEVVRGILEPDGTAPGSVLLEHHSNLTPEKQTWRGKILAENWDAPVIYTTSVQFLETLFGAGTRGARRMHQLANAVLIFDEIQTLPVNCVHLFNNAINFLVEQCGSTVVLCTATQPLLNRVDPKKGAIRIPDGNELMPNVKQLFDDLKRVEVKNCRKPGGWTTEEIASLALEETRRTGSCLVIVNTKNAAQALYRLCNDQDTNSAYHLSTNMCPAHRRATLTEIRERLEKLEPTLCISTQLIEAGVDVDFGAVIRFAAGLDSIAQAAGRCNRNGCRETGLVHVVNPKDENLSRLHEIRIGRENADRVLDDYDDNSAKYGNDLIGLKAMNWYYQNYFFARAGDMDYPVSAREIGHDDTLLNLLSGNPVAVSEHCRRTGQAPNIYLRQSFMAAAKAFKAIDAPTRGIIVPHGDDGKALIGELCAIVRPEQEFKLLRRAQQFSVNVFPTVLQCLSDARLVREVQAGTGILYLVDSRYYSSEFGLSNTPEGEMEVLYVGT